MKLKHILLLIGLPILSFGDFFIIQWHNYQPQIWLSTFLLLLIAVTLILTGKETWKRKTAWLALAAGLIVIQQLSQQYQTDVSCRMYLRTIKEIPEDIASAAHYEELLLFPSSTISDTSAYKASESVLRQWLSDANATSLHIGKDYYGQPYIYLELWGFLDSRFGLVYYKEPVPVNYYKPLRHIEGHWYR